MPTDQSLDALTRVLARACRALGDSGYPQKAGRLAADGWVALRLEHPEQALRLDGTMHYIARLEQAYDQVGAPLGPSPTGKETPMSQDRILDVRTEIPKRRHELIFETFNALAPGSAYVLVNDHDPKPLYYQFEAEHAGTYSWKYLEEGPETWRVRIGRVDPDA